MCMEKCLFCGFNSFNLIAADLPVDKIKKCMGNPEDDAENAVLKAEQEIQVRYTYCTYLSKPQHLQRCISKMDLYNQLFNLARVILFFLFFLLYLGWTRISW